MLYKSCRKQNTASYFISDINELKEKLSSLLSSEEENTEEIVNTTNELQSNMQEAGQGIYSEAQADQSDSDDNSKGDDSDTIEGEYKEV